MAARGTTMSRPKFGAPTLLQMATRACVRNVKSIDDVGPLPWACVAGFLKYIESPDQLRKIEERCPQICGETGEIWLSFIQRDIPHWSSRPHQPKNPKLWHKVYRKLCNENQKELEAASNKLRADMQAHEAKKAANQSQLVDISSLPSVRKATRIGRPPPRTASQYSRGQSSQTSDSHLTFTSGSKTKNVMQRVRREAREMSLFSAKNSKLSQPTHRLNDTASRIMAPPRSLVEEHLKPAQLVEVRKASSAKRPLEPEMRNRVSAARAPVAGSPKRKYVELDDADFLSSPKRTRHDVTDASGPSSSPGKVPAPRVPRAVISRPDTQRPLSRGPSSAVPTLAPAPAPAASPLQASISVSPPTSKPDITPHAAAGPPVPEKKLIVLPKTEVDIFMRKPRPQRKPLPKRKAA